MSIAVIITDRNTDALCEALRDKLPGAVIQQWPDIGSPETVEMAVLWNHPQGITDSMTQLKMVVSMGAGMDHIDADANIPNHVKRQRTVTLALKQNMAQYVLQHILGDHRHHTEYQVQQAAKQWQVLERQAKTPVVGFLGLGALGVFVADQCSALGFQTMACTESQKHQSHPCFHGTAGLKQVCSDSDYLVILLPLTEKTQGIINQQTLSWCKPATMLINVARGGHVNELDLIDALDNGHLKHAVLDVFNQEPLPTDHAFWSHPKITITPHSSSRSDVNQTADQIVEFYHSLS